MCYLKCFAENLKEFMEVNGWNEKQFVEKVGIDKSCLSLYLNEKRAPTIDNLVKIADYFNCSTDFLLGYETQKKNCTFKKCPPINERLEFLLKYFNLKPSDVYSDKISKTSYYSWKRGECQPSLDNVILLSKKFKCSVDFVLGRYNDFN